MNSPSQFSELLHEYREIWGSRTILRALIIKNLFGHYKNSILGFGWHFVMPLFLMLIYYVVFTEIRTGAFPNFWIFLASGLFPFNYMVNNIMNGSGCIVSNSGMIKKMYFPRQIIVFAQAISSFIVLVIGYTIVLLLIVISGYELNLGVMWLLPIMLLMMMVFVVGCVLITSAVTVYVRDIQHLLSSISVGFFFLTPMYFEASSVSGPLSQLIWINPFTYYVEIFHSLVYYGVLPDANVAFVCVLLAIAFFGVGSLVFYRLKRGFAERL